MNETQLATIIAEKVVSNINSWTAIMAAIIGFLGAIVGCLITILGNIYLHRLKEKPQWELDKQRITILEKMLDDNRFPEKWRNLSTLAAVIGADEIETKRLLIKANARGSEKADGKWGLIKNQPFPASQ